MNLSRPLPVESVEQTPKRKAEVVPLFDPSLDQALENLNRITGLQFDSYPQSLVNSDSVEP
ncbi:MAG: hypothetical protein ACR2P1_14460 [Pseudomonadales bacterium]